MCQTKLTESRWVSARATRGTWQAETPRLRVRMGAVVAVECFFDRETNMRVSLDILCKKYRAYIAKLPCSNQ